MRVNLILSALLVFLFFAATRNVYHLPFSYGDDHRALAMLHPEKASDTYKTALYNNTPDLPGSFAIDTHIGRFRPLTWAYDKLLCIVCSDNIFLWRLSNLLILFLSVFFLFGILTLLNIDTLSRFIVLALYVFGRNNETWWTLIPPPQDIGECLLLAGMYYWLYYRKKNIPRFYIFPAFLFFLSAISKESFIFCIPVLLFTDYLLLNPTKRIFSKEYLLSTFACLIPFLSLLLTMLHIKKVFAYPYSDSLISILIYNSAQFVIASVFFIAPVALLLASKKAISKNTFVKLSVVTVLWLLVQLVLVKGIKISDQHHYLIPGLLFPLILTALSFTEIIKLSGKLYYSLFAFYAVVVLAFSWNTYTNSSSYSASLRAYYTMLEKIEEDPRQTVVYLSDNPCMGDWISGTSIILSNMATPRNSEICFSSITDSIPAWEKEYYRHSVQNAYKRISFDSLFIPDGKWIILVETPAKNGFINKNISFYTKGDVSFFNVNGKTIKLSGQFYYFSMPYTGWSLGEILKENFAAINYKGFYAIKLDDYRCYDCPDVKL